MRAVAIVGAALFAAAVAATAGPVEHASAGLGCASRPPNDVDPSWVTATTLSFARTATGHVYTASIRRRASADVVGGIHARDPVWSSRLRPAWTEGFPPAVVIGRASGEAAVELPRAFDPTWSPAGTALAYVEGNPSDLAAATIRILDLATATATTVARGWSPAWSSVGSRLAYVGVGFGLPAIHIVDRDGSGDRIVAAERPGLYSVPLGQPKWRPRTDEISFVREDPLGGMSLWLVEADGTNRRAIVPPGAAAGIDASWAPDGMRVALTLYHPLAYAEVGVVDLRTHRLTRFGATGWNFFEPTWSPDGRHVAFAASRAEGNDGDFDRSEIWLADPKLHGIRRVTNHCIVGTSNADTLFGSPLPDIVRGGDGDDRIYVRDGRRDVVECGAGRDVVFADTRDVVRGCEIVRRP